MAVRTALARGERASLLCLGRELWIDHVEEDIQFALFGLRHLPLFAQLLVPLLRSLRAGSRGNTGEDLIPGLRPVLLHVLPHRFLLFRSFTFCCVERTTGSLPKGQAGDRTPAPA